MKRNFIILASCFLLGTTFTLSLLQYSAVLESSKQVQVQNVEENGAGEAENGGREPSKILCLVSTYPPNHKSQAIPVRNTWGRKCSKILFMSSPKPDMDLEAICTLFDDYVEKLDTDMYVFYEKYCNDTEDSNRKDVYEELESSPMWQMWYSPPFEVLQITETEEGRDGLWNKTRQGFQYVHDNFLEEFDWFLKADDDTYVIVENLRKFLSGKNPDEAVSFGCQFNLPNENYTALYKEAQMLEYMSGGGGYVLSREALRRFGAFEWDSDTIQYRGSEDLMMGIIMHEAGVTFGDSKDLLGRQRFFPLSASSLPDPSQEEPDWFWDLTNSPVVTGFDCCSRTSISFHYMTGSEMYMTEFLLFHIDVK